MGSFPSKMSKNFTFNAMTITKRQDLQEYNRSLVTPELYKTGVVLCETILEPIIRHFGKSMIISSGYRCTKLNNIVGGVSGSQHPGFEAADFAIPGIRLADIFEYIGTSNLNFGQCILEPGWIHVSLGYPYRKSDSCGQTYIYDGYKYTVKNFPKKAGNGISIIVVGIVATIIIKYIILRR